eukprot:Phypoly_transcript_10277.p2 GENE.Phypoly_transcript_10277~~Phypoly_transcript_10277.p2  ORF type:complete len:144 (+),score=41.62 Phypoly_transcript_10277:217-648(+)
MDSTKTLDDSNIFVKFLPPSVDDVELKRLFRPFGGIVSAKVMLDPHTWKSLGYGFVKFNTKEEANLAIEKMSGHRMGNKVLLCKISNHSNFSDPSPNVYIKPLPFSFSEGVPKLHKNKTKKQTKPKGKPKKKKKKNEKEKEKC